MTCPKCGNNNVSIQTSTYMKSKRRSFLWNLFMILITGGLWIIWMLVRRKKEKKVTTKTAVCQGCGYSWKVR